MVSNMIKKITIKEKEDYRLTLPEYRRYEKFQWLDKLYDVVAANIVIERYNLSLELMNQELVEAWAFALKLNYEFGTSPHYILGAHCDETHIQNGEIDLNRPLIYLQIVTGKGKNKKPHCILIDGVHRLRKAWLNKSNLQAYFIPVNYEKLIKLN
jgi:hypothetical protein